ncbi:hypothetical protein FISHEDRAFT_67225 [Fistulina hepatica ATCC 64428]|uniref:Dbl homology domain-containing protein n=1 Tax=Fistulina hepatica ATCC 64428 TaxID=1128425 RepID=A0A0D7A3M6_9AGAR|nr:hypothetical protein FISHEDRAFT_67225 [Fistulina hepatica ATCC 64428]
MPFRRISLPTRPSPTHRQSVISISSFGSLPEAEENEASGIASPVYPYTPSPSRASLSSPTKSPSKRHHRKLNGSAEPGMRQKSQPLDAECGVKRRKIINEFYETERAYVDGLELIYSHFLSPLIVSLSTPDPLLDRSALTSIFSNFIDIWNLHRSFFSALTAIVEFRSESADPPAILPALLSHFPYLSLYTPFVTAFPSTMAALNDLRTPGSLTYAPSFAAFATKQESDPRCGRLKLRDWLLTIVQRCPRYLLLLKDLLNNTEEDDPDFAQLTNVHSLVSKITLSLNTSLHNRTQIMSILALQRATPTLPFQLITPGRSLLKRGALYQVERSEPPRVREFLLFSDYLLWLASEDSERNWGLVPAWTASVLDSHNSTDYTHEHSSARPPIVRTRSKSEADTSEFAARSAASTVKAVPLRPSPSRGIVPPLRPACRRSSGTDDRWVYKGSAKLVDLELVVTPPCELGDDRRFEVLSPESSFVVFADNERERDEWAAEIRQAKAQLLASLAVTHLNSTLTSSSSTNHLRRTLEALPYHPSDERLSGASPDSKGLRIERQTGSAERRGKVDHWVPAIWIPDEKTEGCMRCGRPFGWRRRRHHCRLCGRCVCSICSDKTFYISDPNTEFASSKPARSCNACYDTVFPVLDPASGNDAELSPTMSDSGNTLSSLGNLPLWLSMPSLPLPASPEALMAIDGRHRLRRMSRGAITPSRSRPRSFLQLLEDFRENDLHNERPGITTPLAEEGSDAGEEDETEASPLHTPSRLRTSPVPARRENTARMHKRFSLPAIALQTANVTARTHTDAGGGRRSTGASGAGSPRFSLMLSKTVQVEGSPQSDASNGYGHGVAAERLSELLKRHQMGRQAAD